MCFQKHLAAPRQFQDAEREMAFPRTIKPRTLSHFSRKAFFRSCSLVNEAKISLVIIMQPKKDVTSASQKSTMEDCFIDVRGIIDQDGMPWRSLRGCQPFLLVVHKAQPL